MVDRFVRFLFYLYFGIAGADMIRSAAIHMAMKAKHAQLFDQLRYSKVTGALTSATPRK